jgi:hypothetical protein
MLTATASSLPDTMVPIVTAFVPPTSYITLTWVAPSGNGLAIQYFDIQIFNPITLTFAYNLVSCDG